MCECVRVTHVGPGRGQGGWQGWVCLRQVIQWVRGLGGKQAQMKDVPGSPGGWIHRIMKRKVRVNVGRRLETVRNQWIQRIVQSTPQLKTAECEIVSLT